MEVNKIVAVMFLIYQENGRGMVFMIGTIYEGSELSKWIDICHVIFTGDIPLTLLTPDI